MSYSLSFLPEVADDAIAGFMWYERKAKGLGEEFLEFFMPVQMNYNTTHYCSKKFIRISDGGYLKDFRMQYISGL